MPATQWSFLWGCIGGLLAGRFTEGCSGTMPAHLTKLQLRSLHGLWDIWFHLGATAHI